jgi:hypothetical protein
VASRRQMAFSLYTTLDRALSEPTRARSTGKVEINLKRSHIATPSLCSLDFTFFFLNFYYGGLSWVISAHIGIVLGVSFGRSCY